MKLEEAIKTALEFENNVHVTYVEAEENAEDPVGKRIFGVLAREELGHIEYLEHCLKDWKKTGRLTVRSLETVIPPRQKIEEGLERLRKSVTQKKELSTVELDYLQQAIEAEQNTANFYKRMVRELDEDGQQLFSRFVEIEEGHLAIVQAEWDSVKGLGYWFDMPEWQFPDG